VLIENPSMNANDLPLSLKAVLWHVTASGRGSISRLKAFWRADAVVIFLKN